MTDFKLADDGKKNQSTSILNLQKIPSQIKKNQIRRQSSRACEKKMEKPRSVEGLFLYFQSFEILL